MSFYMGTGKRLSGADFIALAQQSGFSESLLRAFNKVEAPKGPFYSSGALTTLYEPHVAYRNAPKSKRDKMLRMRVSIDGKRYPLARKKWKRGSYPRNSFPLIDKCASFAGTETAARACSWGAFQVLGENAKSLGFQSAVKMVKYMAKGEREQLDVAIRYLERSQKALAACKSIKKLANSTPIKDLGRDGKNEENFLDHFRTLAGYYNGSGYEANGYHEKLRDAFIDFWVVASKRVTKPTPKPRPDAPQPAPDKPKGGSDAAAGVGIIAALVGLFWALWERISEGFCSLLPFMCG